MSNYRIPAGEIWLLTDSRKFGGIESHVIELAKGLQSHHQCVRVILFSRYGSDNELTKRLDNAGLSCDSLDELFPSTNPFFALLKLVKQSPPFILHAHGYKAGIVCKIASLFIKTPVAVSYHAGESPKGKVWLYDLIDRHTAFLSQIRFSVSPAIDNKIPFRTVVLNNFVSLPSPLTKRGKHIAFAGRLSHEKAPDRFIHLARRFPEHSFVLYGEGEMKEQLQSDAPSNVYFAGYQQMSEVWQDIEILVIPSRFEGLPMVALEAMARTVPVIAMDVGALSRLISPPNNGWLCQTEHQLVSALQSWIQMSSAQRIELQNHCRTTIEQHFSDQKVIPEILSHYQRSV